VSSLLEVHDLTIRFPALSGYAVPVSAVSLRLDRGGTLDLVGESGRGQTLPGLALLGLVPHPGRVDSTSRVLLDGVDVTRLTGDALRAIRGGRVRAGFQ